MKLLQLLDLQGSYQPSDIPICNRNCPCESSDKVAWVLLDVSDALSQI